MSTLTEHGEIGVSMSTLLAAKLCPACLYRIRRIMAADIKRLELKRAGIAGEIGGIDYIIA
jgi:hypothetical protein